MWSWLLCERTPAATRMVPIYPALFFVAWIVTIFASSTASLQTLGRRWFVGLVIVIAFQLLTTAVARNGYLGAALVMVLFTTLVGMSVVGVDPVRGPDRGDGLRSDKRRAIASLPWAPFTRMLNIVATLTRYHRPDHRRAGRLPHAQQPSGARSEASQMHPCPTSTSSCSTAIPARTPCC